METHKIFSERCKNEDLLSLIKVFCSDGILQFYIVDRQEWWQGHMQG